MKIKVDPHETYRDINEEELYIIFSPEKFNIGNFPKEVATISLIKIFVKKLYIIVDDGLSYKDILVDFSSCCIDGVRASHIKSKHISINFFNCILGGVIDSGNIKYLSTYNCLLKSIFFTNQNVVNLTYNFDNLLLYEWKNIAEKVNIKSLVDLLSIKQSIHIFYCNIVNVEYIYGTNNNDKEGVFRPINPQERRSNLYYKLPEKDLYSIDTDINLHFNQFKFENVSLNNCILNILSLQGKGNGNISIERNKTNELYVRDFKVEGSLLLYDIEPYRVTI